MKRRGYGDAQHAATLFTLEQRSDNVELDTITQGRLAGARSLCGDKATAGDSAAVGNKIIRS